MNKFFWLAFTLGWMLFAQAAFGQSCPAPLNGTLGVRSNEAMSVTAVDGATVTLTSSSSLTGTVEWFLDGLTQGTTGTTKSITFTMTVDKTGKWTAKIGGADTGEEITVGWVRNREVLANSADIEALKKLYYSTDGPNWTNVPASWTIGGVRVGWNPAQWNNTSYSLQQRFPGVLFGACDRVTSIVLDGVLRGQLPQGDDFATNGGLSELRSIYIRGNSNLTGPIPTTLNRLKKLEILHMSGNGFTGTFPNLTQLTQLRVIDINSNFGITAIDPSIGNIASLRELSFFRCRGLTSLPSSLSNLTLQKFNASEIRCESCVPITPGLTSIPQLNSSLLNDVNISYSHVDFNSIYNYLSPTLSCANYRWLQFNLPFSPNSNACTLRADTRGATSYQWRRRWITDDPIPGATSATLDLTTLPTNPPNSLVPGYYYCVMNVSWNTATCTTNTQLLRTVDAYWAGPGNPCPNPPTRSLRGPSDEKEAELEGSDQKGSELAYPNPVRDGQPVSVRIGDAGVTELSYSVVDAAGTTRRTGRAGIASGVIQVTLDGLSAGLYTITYITGGTPHSVKVVKQ